MRPGAEARRRGRARWGRRPAFTGAEIPPPRSCLQRQQQRDRERAARALPPASCARTAAPAGSGTRSRAPLPTAPAPPARRPAPPPLSRSGSAASTPKSCALAATRGPTHPPGPFRPLARSPHPHIPRRLEATRLGTRPRCPHDRPAAFSPLRCSRPVWNPWPTPNSSLRPRVLINGADWPRSSHRPNGATLFWCSTGTSVSRPRGQP